MFLAAFFTVARDGNNPNVPQHKNGKENTVYTYKGVLLSLKKRN